MNCIQWFKSLIVDREFWTLREEFRLEAKGAGGYFMPKHPFYDFDDEGVYYVDSDVPGNVISHVFTFSEFVDKRIEKEANTALFYIGKQLEVLNEKENAEFHASLISEINTLIYLNEKSDVLGKKVELNQALTKIVVFIRENEQTSMNDTTEIKAMSKQDRENQEIAYAMNRFSFNGLRSQVISLYEALEEAGLFHKDIDQSDNFLNILFPTSTMVADLLPTIRVNCGNEEAAYIFRSIEKHFEGGFNFREIDKSKAFLSQKHGTPFSEENLSGKLTLFNNKVEYNSATQRKKDKIDQALSKLNYKR